MTYVLVKTFCLLSAVFITANCQPTITTTSPEYLCLEDLVQLNCTAQGSVTWESDDILGPGMSIVFNGDQINSTESKGNGTAVLLEKDPRFVTSLLFNLTADRVETSCTDYQGNTTTTISSVQPSPNGDYPVMESGGSITWRPPSNIDDFLLQNYQLTIECNGTVVVGVNTTEATYSYDEGKLIPGLCNVTVRVINSCGDTASNSTLFTFEDTTEDNDGSKTGLIIGLIAGGLALVIVVIIVVGIVVCCYFKTYDEDNAVN